MATKGGPESQEEQGFNEKELADIMNEIETLEAEFDGEKEVGPGEETGEVVAEEAPQPKEMTAPVAKPAAPRPKVVDPVAPKIAQPVMKVAPTGGSPSQMEFHVQGDIQVKFKFYFGDSWVQFSAGPGESPCIEMPGGMKFSWPVSSSDSKVKKAS